MVFNCPGAPSHFDLAPQDHYHLRMRYEGGGEWQEFFTGTFIPKPLKQLIDSGEAHALHIETLVPNSAAKRPFGFKTDYIVMGIRTRDGREVQAVPGELLKARRRYLIEGSVLVALGVLGAALGYKWLGAAAVVAGTHSLRTRATIPHKVFGTGRTR